MDTDRNLLFGVLALQAGLIDAAQFVEACALWASRKRSALADLLLERGWILAADRQHLEYLLERTVQKAGGSQTRLAAIPDEVKRSLAALGNAEIQRSLVPLPRPQTWAGVATTDHARPVSDRHAAHPTA